MLDRVWFLTVSVAVAPVDGDGDGGCVVKELPSTSRGVKTVPFCIGAIRRERVAVHISDDYFPDWRASLLEPCRDGR